MATYTIHLETDDIHEFQRLSRLLAGIERYPDPVRTSNPLSEHEAYIEKHNAMLRDTYRDTLPKGLQSAAAGVVLRHPEAFGAEPGVPPLTTDMADVMKRDEEEKTKRTRRTKAQIAADNAAQINAPAAEGQQASAPEIEAAVEETPAVPVTVEEVRKAVTDLFGKKGALHVQSVLKSATGGEASNMKEVKPEHYAKVLSALTEAQAS